MACRNRQHRDRLVSGERHAGRSHLSGPSDSARARRIDDSRMGYCFMLKSLRDQLVGTVLEGRYQLTRYLGEGAFAWVYEAAEVLAGQHVGRVAVKLIEPQDDEHRQGLIREIQALAQLSHQNVLSYRTAGVASDGPLEGTFYIVTELADLSLEDLRQQGQVSEDVVRAVACEVSAALAYVHSCGAVHRDVKPGNILRVHGMWKLADFGLARAVDGSRASASGRKGTLLYMAPEILDGQVGPACDVYSLGVTLLECLTGHLAHEGTTEGEFMRNLLTKPATIPTDLAAAWRGVVARCLQTDPGRRCMAAELTDLLAENRPGPGDAPAGHVLRAAPTPRVPIIQSHLGHRGPRHSAGTSPSALGWGPDDAAYPTQFVVNEADGAEMVWVPAGEFVMGSTTEQMDRLWKANGWKWAKDTDEPAHRVCITRDFWIYRHPVTNGQYGRFLAATGHKAHDWWSDYSPHSELPVNLVTWDDCVVYSLWATGALPTEAQWEWAARGPNGRLFPWGDEWDRNKCCSAEFWAGRALNDLDTWKTWYRGIGAEEKEGGRWSVQTSISAAHMKPVGSYPDGASWCGALDMAGNVWEWCGDRYQERYYTVSPEEDPPGPASGDKRVVRGGGWSRFAAGCRSADRLWFEPTLRFNNIGFRPVVAPR